VSYYNGPAQRTWQKGEELAEKFLRDKGYDIIAKNWRYDKDEIDIIARDGDEIVIVEVKPEVLTSMDSLKML